MANVVEFKINIGGTAYEGAMKINSAVNSLTSDVKKTIPVMDRLTGIAFKFNTVMQFVSSTIGRIKPAIDGCVKAYNADAEANTKLAAVMKLTMNATDDQIRSIRELASEQQRLGVIGDEVQLAGVQELSTYLQKADSLKKVIPAMNDMIAQQYGLNASQEQAVGIATMVGKVLQGQTGALSRYGYYFDEAQEKILKFGNEEQRVAVLSDIIAESVGGVNAALAATPEGRMKQHANAMGDLQERIGGVAVRIQEAFLPLMEKAAAAFEGIISTIENDIDGIVASTAGAARFIGDLLTGFVIPVLKALVQTIAGVVHFIREWGIVLGALGGIMATFLVALNAAKISLMAQELVLNALILKETILTKVTAAWTVVQKALNWAFASNPIVGVIMVIVTLAGVVVTCWNKFAGFRAVILTVWETVKGFGNIIKQYITDRIAKLLEGLGKLGSAIAKLFRGDFKGAWNDAKEGGIAIADSAVGYSASKNAATSAVSLVKGIGDAYAETLAKEKAKDEAKKAGKEQSAGVPGAEMTNILESNPAASANRTSIIPPGDLTGKGKAAAGDSKIKNIHITIDRVIEQFTVQTTTLRESTGRMRQLVAEAIVEGINDVNMTV